MNNRNKEKNVPTNWFHVWMWIIVMAPIVIGIYGTIKTDGSNLAFIMSTLLGAYLFKNGFRELPHKPFRKYGLITFHGRRKKYFVREGYCMLPKIFLLDLIEIEIKTEDQDIPINVTTQDGYRITGNISISIKPVPENFGSFIDIGLYSGAFNQLKGIAELAGQKITSLKEMEELEKELSSVSESVARILSGEEDAENVHNDIRGLGIELQKVQVTLNPPPEIAEARLKKEVTKQALKGVQEQSAAIIKQAKKLMGIARKNGDATTQFPEFYKKVEEQIQVALNQVEKIVSNANTNPVVITKGNK